MRLDRVYIDGFKNLKQLAVDFDEDKLTTVVIGQNGAGKSNLIEALTQVFRWVSAPSAEFAAAVRCLLVTSGLRALIVQDELKPLAINAEDV